MSITINTNISSLFVRRNLSRTSSNMSAALERLSSGYRINSAKDDAAGIAIASRFTAQVKGYNQGARNAADAISFAQTAEGALDELSSNLQRIRELAVQSANATNSDTDRQALQKEVDQLTQEISRSIQAVEFNGKKLLMGTETLSFQVSADAGENYKINIAPVDLTAPGGGTEEEYVAARGVTSFLLNSSNTPLMLDLMVDKLPSNNSFRGRIGLKGFDFSDYRYSTFPDYTKSLTILDPAIREHKELEAAYQTIISAIDYYNAKGPSVDNNDVYAIAQATANKYKPSENEGSLNSYNQDITATFTINVSTASAALTAISNIDDDLALLNKHRATFGAIENRFESVIRNAENTAENLTAARSRIKDTDFAQETANLVKTQILEQVGISILSQANSLPQLALSLL